MRFIDNKLLIIFPIIFFVYLICTENVFSSLQKEIFLESDYIAYDSEKNIIIASGNITGRINQEITINCDNMQVSINERKVLAQGNIVLQNIDEKQGIYLRGDELFYDIQTSQGRIIRIEPHLEKIYFQGSDFKTLSSILDEKIENYKTDLERSKLVLVCKKILFVFGDRMEAHQVSVWSKGIKILSIPYWSSDFEVELPDIPISLKKIDYDSKDRLKYSMVLNYSKHRKHTGKMNFDYQQRKETYSGKEKDIWKANLVQQFTFGRQKGGTLTVNNIGEKSYSIFLNYNQYIGKNIQINPTLSYSNKSSKTSGIFLTKRFLHSNFSAKYSETKNLTYSKDKSTTLNLAWQKYPRFIENTKLSYSVDTEWNLTKYKNRDESKLTTTLGLSRSGIYLLPKLYLDLNTSFSQTMSKGAGSHYFRGAANSNYLMEIKNSRLVLSAGWSVYSSRQEYSSYSTSSKTETLSINTSFSYKTKWNARADTNYNISTEKWSDTISTALDIKINRLLKISTSGVYNHKKDEFQSVSISGFYNVFGAVDPRYMQSYFTWRKDVKPKTYYYITFNSSI